MVGLVSLDDEKRGYEEERKGQRKNIGIALAKIALQPRLNTIEDINAAKWYFDYISSRTSHKIPHYLTRDGKADLERIGFEDRYVREGFHEQWREISLRAPVNLYRLNPSEFDKKDFQRALPDAVLLSYREDLAQLVREYDRGY